MTAEGDGKDDMAVESQKVERRFEIVNKLGLHGGLPVRRRRLGPFVSGAALDRHVPHGTPHGDGVRRDLPVSYNFV